MKQIPGHTPPGFITGLVASFRYALKGLCFAVRAETNLKIHLAITLAVVAAGLYFGLSLDEWCSISLTIGLVLVSEMLNTAIEQLVNIVSPEHNASAGRVKDVAAGATLVASAVATIVGILIFGPWLLHMLNL